MRRRRTPQVTTDGPESHKIRSRGGRLRKARTRSAHALLNCCLASGIESDDRLAGTRATPDWIQITRGSSIPCVAVSMIGYLSLGGMRRPPERASPSSTELGRSPARERNARSFRLFVGGKLQARGSDGGWTGLFISKLIDFCLKLLR
jgi:hypothetical protein